MISSRHPLVCSHTSPSTRGPGPGSFGAQDPYWSASRPGIEWDWPVRNARANVGWLKGSAEPRTDVSNRGELCSATGQESLATAIPALRDLRQGRQATARFQNVIGSFSPWRSMLISDQLQDITSRRSDRLDASGYESYTDLPHSGATTSLFFENGSHVANRRRMLSRASTNLQLPMDSPRRIVRLNLNRI